MDPKISSDRIKFRLIGAEDVKTAHALLSLPETDQYNALGVPKTEAETRKIIEPLIEANKESEIKNFTFALEKPEGAFIGLFGLKLGKPKYNKAEVWCKILPEYWSKGYATEALKTMLDFGFDTLNLHRIEAGCSVKNTASPKVFKKVGMMREGIARQLLPLKTGWSDVYQYAILETDPRE